MTLPNRTDKEYRREVILRTVAQAAWEITVNLPFELDAMIAQGVVTKEEIVNYFSEELDKLV